MYLVLQGGRLLTSAGHWIELSKLDVTLENLLKVSCNQCVCQAQAHLIVVCCISLLHHNMARLMLKAYKLKWPQWTHAQGEWCFAAMYDRSRMSGIRTSYANHVK